MFEKVNPGHPDKMADRLAGAVVDLVYERAGGLTKAKLVSALAWREPMEQRGQCKLVCTLPSRDRGRQSQKVG